MRTTSPRNGASGNPLPVLVVHPPRGRKSSGGRIADRASHFGGPCVQRTWRMHHLVVHPPSQRTPGERHCPSVLDLNCLLGHPEPIAEETAGLRHLSLQLVPVGGRTAVIAEGRQPKPS